MNLFKTLRDTLSTGEKLQLHIEAGKDGQLTVLVLPVLKAAPESLSDAQAQLRGALSIPLRVSATADELDADFVALLTQYNTKRGELVHAMDTLDQLNEAAKQANKAAQKAQSKVAAKTAQPADKDEDDGERDKEAESGNQGAMAGNTVQGAVPAPSSTVQATNPDSLF